MRPSRPRAQYIEFLTDTLAAGDYAALLPPLDDLVLSFGVDAEIAFKARPSPCRRRINRPRGGLHAPWSARHLSVLAPASSGLPTAAVRRLSARRVMHERRCRPAVLVERRGGACGAAGGAAPRLHTQTCALGAQAHRPLLQDAFLRHGADDAAAAAPGGAGGGAGDAEAEEGELEDGEAREEGEAPGGAPTLTLPAAPATASAPPRPARPLSCDSMSGNMRACRSGRVPGPCQACLQIQLAPARLAPFSQTLIRRVAATPAASPPVRAAHPGSWRRRRGGRAAAGRAAAGGAARRGRRQPRALGRAAGERARHPARGDLEVADAGAVPDVLGARALRHPRAARAVRPRPRLPGTAAFTYAGGGGVWGGAGPCVLSRTRADPPARTRLSRRLGSGVGGDTEAVRA